MRVQVLRSNLLKLMLIESFVEHPTRVIPCDNQSARACSCLWRLGVRHFDSNVIFLSPRAWLAQWPRRLQLFAVALLLLATVAQNWHVCAMSGHDMSGHAMSGAEHSSHVAGHGAHGVKQFRVIYNANGTPGPVICECAHPDEPQGQAISALPAAHDHVTCLALLLQTMPLQAGVPFTLDLTSTPRPIYAQHAQIAPAFAAPLPRRGRAPPLGC